MDQLKLDYQKEYAILIGQIDRALSVLELCTPLDPFAFGAQQLLSNALLEAEEHFVARADG